MIWGNDGNDHGNGRALRCNQLKVDQSERKADRETDKARQYSILVRVTPPPPQAWDWISL